MEVQHILSAARTRFVSESATMAATRREPRDANRGSDRCKRVFISYAREDRLAVDAVVEGLRSLGNEAWLDTSLAGGQAWWDAILDEILDCDVFLEAMSPSALESEACNREREYAHALSKPILPVLVRAVSMEALPSDLALLQCVDYTAPTADAAFHLARGIDQCAGAQVVPTELPPRPPVPLSYLSSISDCIRASSLSLDEQLALVAKLRGAIGHDSDRAGALELLNRLQQREDLFLSCAEEIDRTLTEHSRDASRQATDHPPDGLDLAAPHFDSATRNAVERYREANRLVTEALGLEQLDRHDAAIAAFDGVVARFGNASETAVREQVALALVNKGTTLGRLGRSQAAIDAFDEVIERFGDAQDLSTREQVADALHSKSTELASRGHKKECLATLDQLIGRYVDATEPSLQTYVANARYDKRACAALPAVAMKAFGSWAKKHP